MRVFLHANDVEEESGLQFRVGNVRLLIPQTGGPNESLVFGRLSGVVFGNEGGFVDDSLPGLSAPLPSFDDREHLGLGHRLDLGNGHLPFACIFLSLLLDHVRQNLVAVGSLSVHQEGRDRDVVLFLLLGSDVLFLVGLDGLLDVDLLLVPLLVEDLRLDSPQLLGLLGYFFVKPTLFFASC